jgi:tetratricopeptide (TPR) repeat protein
MSRLQSREIVLSDIYDMDYERAIVLLGPYQDYNTAVTYTSMGRNVSALQILEKLEKTAQVNYLLGIIYAREGRIEEAVKHYMDSCRQNPQYIHRGNLDPEISDLIKAYNLHEILYKEQEEEDMLL